MAMSKRQDSNKALENLLVVCAVDHSRLHGLQECDTCQDRAVLTSVRARQHREKVRIGVVPVLNLCERCHEKATME